MSHLKIKVNIGSFNVELEGESEEVISQFQELKKNGLGEIVDQLVPKLESNSRSINSKVDKEVVQEMLISESNPLDNFDISLQNVVYKQLPKSETEWILLYGYFLDREGKNNFTRSDLIQKYEESKRKSEVRIKNLSASIKAAVSNSWISALNDKDFIITDKGRNHSDEILTRQEGTSKAPKRKQKKNEN